MSVPVEALLGKLAVHYKLISEDQLAEATRQQEKQEKREPIGELFVEFGWMTRAQLTKLLEVQKQLVAQRAATATPGGAAAPSVALPATKKKIDRLLGAAFATGASDIHLHAGEPFRVRRMGQLETQAGNATSSGEIEVLLEEILRPQDRDELRRRGQVDFGHTIPGLARFRGNAYREQHGTGAVFRALAEEPPTLAALGLPDSLARFTNFHQGLVLVTGPAGCGKSSTMAALLRLINEERREHVITIEDPIEYLHRSRRAVVNQRQVGRDTADFARALRAALREDPDVIAIGELRDLETISLALTASETGHLVLATLHTGSAVRTIDRLVGVFPPSQQNQVRTMLSESLRAVISQRLANRADGTGRVAALEILVGTRAVANLIRENKTFQIRSIMQTGATHGMVLLDAALTTLARSGVITREEALRHADDPKAILE